MASTIKFERNGNIRRYLITTFNRNTRNCQRNRQKRIIKSTSHGLISLINSIVFTY